MRLEPLGLDQPLPVGEVPKEYFPYLILGGISNRHVSLTEGGDRPVRIPVPPVVPRIEFTGLILESPDGIEIGNQVLGYLLDLEEQGAGPEPAAYLEVGRSPFQSFGHPLADGLYRIGLPLGIGRYKDIRNYKVSGQSMDHKLSYRRQI